MKKLININDMQRLMKFSTSNWFKTVKLQNINDKKYLFFNTPFNGFLRLSGVGCIDILLGVFWVTSRSNAIISCVNPLWFSFDSARLVTPVGVSPSHSKILFLFLARKLKFINAVMVLLYLFVAVKLLKII